MAGDVDEVVLLGTSGGPKWRQSRSGIATAVVVDGAVYLVDCGYGAGAQLVRAGLSPADLSAVLITHLHSDHTADLANLLLYGWFDSRRFGPRTAVSSPCGSSPRARP
jgi:ribonuclease BN (tRNA processing enzyme)